MRKRWETKTDVFLDTRAVRLLRVSTHFAFKRVSGSPCLSLFSTFEIRKLEWMNYKSDPFLESLNFTSLKPIWQESDSIFGIWRDCITQYFSHAELDTLKAKHKNKVRHTFTAFHKAKREVQYNEGYHFSAYPYHSIVSWIQMLLNGILG